MSKQINRSIVIDAKVKTTLEGMNEVVSKLNQGLRDGATKVDLTKGVGSSLSKQLDKFKDEYSKFSKYIEGDKIEFADSKDAIKSGEALIKTFKEMRRIVGDFDDLTVLDAKKLFPDAFDSKVTDLLKGLNGLSTAMTKLESKQLDLSTAQTELGELTREAERFQNLIDQEATLKLELDKAKSDLEHFDSEIEAIRAKAAKGITLKINTATAAQDEAKKRIEEIETTRSTRGFNQEDFSGTTARAVKFKGKTEKQWKDESTKKDASEASKAEAAAALEAIRVYRQEENALKDLNTVLQARKKEVDSLRESLANINNMKVSQAVEMAGGTTEEINEANTAMQVYAAAAKEASEAQGRYNTAVSQAKGASDKLEKTNAALETQQAKIDKITLEIGELNKEVSTEALEKAFSTAGIENFSAEMLKSKDGIEQLRTKLNELDDQRLKALKLALADIGLGADKAEDYVEQLRGTLSGVRDTADDIKRSASEMENLKNQVLQFFSLTNSVQLFKRAVTKAMNTVKELDATMTEAAVVTEFDVGDMWDKLPEYSAQAQKLGVSINGMYQATTLYYQQGLRTNEAMALGVETMKMAKIAGLESADATKAMTAALRGFNMELDETSAIRVNDVYSQLAAVTAADVSQISTAMEKTASIAASANMEFETTAALLAQIIETTQEAPETAGTAMKTIIARFSEVKNLKSQGLTTGKDSEGEDIDVNKIQTALRTVGISMDGFFAGTEGLDSVLLKLAEKWEGLDFETQRYIATMAAGSRQQSRFIAMMSDYGRTTELVGEAQNSAGASQRQYEKTLDSMESKLQKLENAWNQFLMGLTNNTILKGAVDGLTFIIEGVNKLTDAISGGNGLAKSIVSLTTVVGALKLGKGLLGGGLGWAGGKLGMGATSTKETITETGPDGQTTVKTIVKEPFKEGQQSGQQAGQGFLAGFKNAIASKKEGGSALKGFFTTGKNEAKLDGKIKGRNPITKKGKAKRAKNQQAVDQEKDIFMQSVKDNNKDNANFSDKNLDEISNIYDDIIQKGGNAKQAAEGANAAIGDMGGQLGTVGENAQNTSLGLQGATLNMGALGGAVSGVGGALGLLASLFEELGLEEWAEPVATLAAVFMGLGSVMSLLSTIAPVLGMSFTTAGVQITIAGVTSQLAWWWVFLIIAAVAVLIGLVVALVKAAKENSLAGQMEAAAERTKAAAEAAASAKEAYDELFDDRDEYNDLQNALSEAKRGTEEFKQALFEANQQVLELLHKYPELAKYIETGEFGQLTINQEGWDKQIEYQKKTVVNTNNALSLAQVEESKLKQKSGLVDFQSAVSNAALYSKVTDEDGYTMYGSTYASEYDASTGMTTYSYLYDEMLDLYELDPAGFFAEQSDALEYLSKKYHVAEEDLRALSGALKEYNELNNVEEQKQIAQYKATLTANASEETLSSEYADQLTDTWAQAMNRGIDEAAINAKKNEIYEKDGSSEANKEGRFKQLADEYGVTTTGNDKKDLEALYAKMAGIDVKDISDDLKGNKDALAKEIARMDLTNDYTKRMESFRTNLDKLDTTEQKKLMALTSGDGSKLTYKQMANAGSLSDYAVKMGYQTWGDMAKDMGYSDKTLGTLDAKDQRAALKKMHEAGQLELREGETVENMSAERVQELVNAHSGTVITASAQLQIDTEQAQEDMKAFWEQTVADLEAKGVKISGTSLENLSAGVLENLGNQVKTMSEEDAQAYADSFSRVLGSAKAVDQEGIANYLSTVDWSNLTEANLAMEYLQEKGLDDSIIQQYFDTATEGAGAFVSSMEEAAALINKAQAALSGLADTSERFREGTAGIEDIQKLVDAGMDVQKYIKVTDEGFGLQEDKIDEFEYEYASKIAQQQQSNASANASAVNKFMDQKYTSYYMGGSAEGNLYEFFKNQDQYVGLENSKSWYTGNNSWQGAGIAEATLGGSYEKTRIQKADGTYETEEEWVSRGWDKGVELYEATQNQPLLDAGADWAKMKQNVEGVQLALSTLSENWTDWSKILQDPSHAKYGETLKALQENTKKLLGTTKDLPEKFLKSEKAMQLMQRAADGDATAIDELRKEAAKEIALDLGLKEGAVNEVYNAVSDFIDSAEYDDIEIGTRLETTSLWSFFTDMLKAGKITAEEMNTILDGIGWTPDITYAEVPIGEASSYLQHTNQQVINPVTGQLETVTAENIGQFATDGIVKMPIIGDNAKHFSGFDLKTNSTFEGTGESFGGSGDDDGGGGGGSSSNWENPYDELYNTLRKINEELRKREKLERRYQALLEKTNVSAKELAENKEAQITNLESQRYLQQQVVQGRKDQIQEAMNENSSLNKYANVEYDEQGNPILRINYDEIAKVTDEDKGAEIEEYIGELEELVDGMDEANDELEVIDDTIKEIRDRGREGFVDLETRLMDALVNSYQEEIDALTETSEAIDEANSRLIDGIQTVLDAERQERSNEKTEEDIANKQARLAYLQMDTSGANQTEILSLQKEIEDAQEDYTDTLIDQKISELQKQNEEASLQRERQIELAQSQLDYWQETGALWGQVHTLMNDMINEDGTINIGSEGYQMLMQSEGFPSLSALAQSDWAQDISSLAAEVFSWIHKDNTVKALLDSKDLEAGESLTFTDASGDEITGTIQKDGTVKTADGKVFSGVYRDPMTMEYQTNEEADDIQVETAPPPPPAEPEPPEVTEQDKWGTALAIWNSSERWGWGKGNTRVNRLNEVFGENNGIQALVNKGAKTVARNATGQPSDYSYEKMKEKFKKYKTGGLADYTGLAWLDGTKSKPELVLNQEETQMFIALKDVLAGFMKNRNGSGKTTNNGDNYFEIDINVEKLESTYDIEQVAADVKDLIRRDATARGVNLIGPKS